MINALKLHVFPFKPTSKESLRSIVCEVGLPYKEDMRRVFIGLKEVKVIFKRSVEFLKAVQRNILNLKLKF